MRATRNPVRPGREPWPPTWDQNKYASAFNVLDAWPEATWEGKLGKDFALLTRFLDYKAEFYGEAVDEFKPLAEDAEYAKQRPELLYYMGRAFYANASCAKAVSALERTIELQTALGRPLLPTSASLEQSEAKNGSRLQNWPQV